MLVLRAAALAVALVCVLAAGRAPQALPEQPALDLWTSSAGMGASWVGFATVGVAVATWLLVRLGGLRARARGGQACRPAGAGDGSVRRSGE